MKSHELEKYKTSTHEEYEPESNDTVLKNKLGIIDSGEMEVLETKALKRAHKIILDKFDSEYRFSSNDVCTMHRIWLSKLYYWAGKYRNVNISKGNFSFAAAYLIPKLMSHFEEKILSVYTPCKDMHEVELIEALSIVHVEFILIHPFREGNGRIGRLLTSLMAMQADYPPLNYSLIEECNQQESYFSAIREGLGKNYKPMQIIFSDIVKMTKNGS